MMLTPHELVGRLVLAVMMGGAGVSMMPSPPDTQLTVQQIQQAGKQRSKAKAKESIERKQKRKQRKKMTMQSIQLATVSGVVSMIEKVADEAIKNNSKAPAGMMTAMEAVCNLLESRGKGDKAVAGAVAKVRKACGIEKKGTKNESLA